MDQEKYTVIGLSNNDVGQGALSSILDIISDAFFKSGQWAMQNRQLQPKEHWAKAFCHDFLSLEGSPTKYGSEYEVYLNDEALGLLKKAGYKMEIVGTDASLPEKTVTLSSMPIWR